MFCCGCGFFVLIVVFYRCWCIIFGVEMLCVCDMVVDLVACFGVVVGVGGFVADVVVL